MSCEIITTAYADKEISKGRGKSGGARVITFNALVSEQDGKVYLLLIYDKSDTPNVKLKVVQDIVTELNL